GLPPYRSQRPMSPDRARHARVQGEGVARLRGSARAHPTDSAAHVGGQRMDLGLTGKVAIITGGSEGIGYASALSLAREGARVAIAARRPDVLEAAADRIRQETG